VIVDRVEKVYITGQRTVAARRGVSLELLPGEFVALMGRSGFGYNPYSIALFDSCGIPVRYYRRAYANTQERAGFGSSLI